MDQVPKLTKYPSSKADLLVTFVGKTSEDGFHVAVIHYDDNVIIALVNLCSSDQVDLVCFTSLLSVSMQLEFPFSGLSRLERVL